MATHSSILAQKTPWLKEPSRLQPMVLQRDGHDFTFTFIKMKIRQPHFANYTIIVQALYYLLTSFEIRVKNDIKSPHWFTYSCLLLSAADTLSSLFFVHAVNLLIQVDFALDVPVFLLKISLPNTLMALNLTLFQVTIQA